MLRHLKSSEVELCLDGGMKFFAESKRRDPFIPEAFIQSWRRIIDGGFGTIIASFNPEGQITGALGGIIAPELSNFTKVSVEAFWYTIPGHRGHGIGLLKAYEKWATEQGVDRIGMTHLKGLNPEKLGDLYERMGYVETETNYIKDIKPTTLQNKEELFRS